jgi:hypothetical protein
MGEAGIADLKTENDEADGKKPKQDCTIGPDAGDVYHFLFDNTVSVSRTSVERDASR